jgi:hypothetical protein
MGDEGGLRRLHPDDLHALAKLVASVVPRPKDGQPGKPGDPGRHGKDVDMVAVEQRLGAALRALRQPEDGPPGPPGTDGWTPQLAVVRDGARRVLQLRAWFGGTGKKPVAGYYLGEDGFTRDLSQATDIRGPAGESVRPAMEGASDVGLRQFVKKVIRQEGLTLEQILELIEENTMEDFDQVLVDDQTNSGGAPDVLTFTFGADVHKVWVKLLPANAEDTSTARVRVDGGVPDADTGHQIEAGIPQPISAVTSVVKVYVPAGKSVNVTGYRRRT